MIKLLRTKNGHQYKVIDENGKYYICEDTQFSKVNPAIITVEEVEEKKESVREDNKAEEPKENKPKRKTTAKKSPKEKKGE